MLEIIWLIGVIVFLIGLIGFIVGLIKSCFNFDKGSDIVLSCGVIVTIGNVIVQTSMLAMKNLK